MNYEVEQKRHWRYWVWKRIAQNCGVHPSFATVLFLSGPSPSDLQAATKYGFKLRNIVAVDMNAECVEAARRAGCTAIQGSLHEVVTKWTDGAIHGIVADYCFGLTLNNMIDSYQICSKANACALNFQRGRESDESSKKLRGWFQCVNRAELMKFMMLAITRSVLFMEHKYSLQSKEGIRFWDYVICPDMVYSLHKNDRKLVLRMRELVFNKCFWEMAVEQWVDRDEMQDHMTNCLTFPRMEMCSYRSNKVVMDSLVGPIGAVAAKSSLHELRTANEIDRRLAAVKAIRTMNGAVKMHAASN